MDVSIFWESANFDASPNAGAGKVVCGRQQSVSNPSEIGHVTSDSRRSAASWFKFLGSTRGYGVSSPVCHPPDVWPPSTAHSQYAGLVAQTDAPGRAVVDRTTLVATHNEVVRREPEPAGCRGASVSRYCSGDAWGNTDGLAWQRRGIGPAPRKDGAGSG